MKATLKTATILTTLLVFAGCGGSGGGGGGGNSAAGAVPPAGPAVTLGFGVKELRFAWSAVSGADFYRLLENPDGVSGYTQVGADFTALAVNHTLAVHRRLNASYIVEACNSAGCTGSAPQILGANLAQAIGYVKASNTGAGDGFGGAVALSGDGNTLVVGAGSEASNAAGIDGDQADNSATNAGAVYVFVRSGGAWSQQAYLKASNTDAGDVFGGFGEAVALSSDGDTLAVAALGEASNATGINGDQTDNSAPLAGAVYIFTRSGGAWSQQAYLKASNTESNDRFGFAVALSGDGNTLAVGAHLEDSNATGINGNQADNSAANAGAVYVFTRGGSTWSQQAYVKGSNTNAGDSFGGALALNGDGTTLAVAAFNEDSNATGIDGAQADNSAADAGAVYVFTRSGSTWSQQAYVKGSNTEAGDTFGLHVALSGDGNTLAVTAGGEDSNATGIDGAQADNSAPGAGAVYVFTRGGSSWSQQAYVKASNTEAGDFFGVAVASSADGNALAVGAHFEASAATGIDGDQIDNSAANAGAVYVFTRSGSTWSQQAYVKATNTGSGDTFGFNVALDSNGSALAVAAFSEDSNATGVGGDQTDNSAPGAGAVCLY